MPVSGRVNDMAKSGRGRSLLLGALLALGVGTLAGCEAANESVNHAMTDVYQQTALMDNVDHLSPWVAPQKGTVFQFLPFSGVPVNTADAIYKNIRAHATENGITLALRLDEPATYRVRTLISAVGTTNTSIFVFIGEIYDVQGKRVYRFTGQEYGPAPNGDQWSGIDADTERHLGERILADVKAWATRAM